MSEGGERLTLDVQLDVDDVAHHRRVVEVFDRLLGSAGAGEEDARQAQVLSGFGVVEDLHLFHFAVFSAHLGQKGLPDVVVQAGEGHFFQWDLADVELVQLRPKRKGELEKGTHMAPKVIGMELKVLRWPPN